MRQNHIVQEDGSYREYIVATHLDERDQFSEDPLAIVGLLVATKPQGLCTTQAHRSTRIVELDVARSMHGKRLAPHLLDMLVENHPEDPYIDLEVYQHNGRAKGFYSKLGFAMDAAIPLRDGAVYQGKWITMATTGQVFSSHLSDLLS